jgi:hypothetical protein
MAWAVTAYDENAAATTRPRLPARSAVIKRASNLAAAQSFRIMLRFA